MPRNCRISSTFFSQRKSPLMVTLDIKLEAMNPNDPHNAEAMAALKVSKRNLRSLMKNKLKVVQTHSIKLQSARIFESLVNLKAYHDAKRIGIYLSMPGGEVQTDAIVRHALKEGKQVFVPYLHKAQTPPPNTPLSVMDMVDLRSLSDYESLKRDSWGIPTIGADTVKTRESVFENGGRGLDMILMPGVAFEMDSFGRTRRLGHGKGYYDYFLHRYRQSLGPQVEGRGNDSGSDVKLYGLALEEQYLTTETGDSVPVGPQDSFLNGLVVGDGRIL